MTGEGLFHEFAERNIIAVEDGRLKILDRIDISSYGSNAWVFTLQTLAEKKSEKYLFDLGYMMGKDAAQECKELIDKKKAFVTQKLTDLKNIIEVTGFGLVNVEITDKEATVKVDFNHIIQIGCETYKEESHICSFYRGVYSAFIEAFHNIKIKLEEKECICHGDKQCIFSAKMKR